MAEGKIAFFFSASLVQPGGSCFFKETPKWPKQT
jgi:hypothetical protein